MAFHQDHAGRSNVQAQPQQRCKEEHCRKAGKIKRLVGVERDHEDRKRNHDIGYETNIQQYCRQWQHHEDDEQ